MVNRIIIFLLFFLYRTYWQYKGYDDFTTAASMESEGFFYKNGSIQIHKARALVRPYPVAVCGSSITESVFKNLKYKLEYVAYSNEDCKTEIFVPT